MSIRPEDLVSRPADKSNSAYAKQQLALLKPLSFNRKIPSATTLIFLHIPKTAGTNLDFLAQARSKIEPSFKQARAPVPRIPGYSPILITDGWIGGLKTAFANLKADQNHYRDFNFISGHFPFGLHTHINTASKVQYVTLIRNPIEREISSTNFDFQRGYVEKEAVEKYLLETCMNNPQTRMLAGPEHMSGICDEAVLKKAKENILSHFLLTGVTEDANAFMQILISIQGWGPFALCEAQVTGEKAIVEPSLELQSKLKQKHVFDLQLYEWAKKRWFKWKHELMTSQKEVDGGFGKIPCLFPDFSTNRTPVFLSQKEIDEYNKKTSKDLIPIQQKHVAPQILTSPAPPLLTQYSLSQTQSLASSKRPNTNLTEESSSTVTPKQNPFDHCSIL